MNKYLTESQVRERQLSYPGAATQRLQECCLHPTERIYSSRLSSSQCFFIISRYIQQRPNNTLWNFVRNPLVKHHCTGTKKLTFSMETQYLVNKLVIITVIEIFT
jgi:hypothetical protein